MPFGKMYCNVKRSGWAMQTMRVQFLLKIFCYTRAARMTTCPLWLRFKANKITCPFLPTLQQPPFRRHPWGRKRNLRLSIITFNHYYALTLTTIIFPFLLTVIQRFFGRMKQLLSGPEQPLNIGTRMRLMSAQQKKLRKKSCSRLRQAMILINEGYFIQHFVFLLIRNLGNSHFMR